MIPTIRVTAPSRLHFGLIHLGDESSWPDRNGEGTLPARQFGGVGMMIESPGVCVRCEPAAEWSAEGPLASRALELAHRYAGSMPDLARPRRIVIEHAGPEHVGLGVGTQLALAVGKALALSWGIPADMMSARGIARRMGRGLRSALGLHGFEHGGFLVDGGKRIGDAAAPLIAHISVPESWRVVLVIPPDQAGTHGPEEKDAFARLVSQRRSLRQTEALCRLVLLGMLPALVEGDFEGFAAAVGDFNLRVGDLFAPVQGGPYAFASTDRIVRKLRQEGVRGVGQSSWGPTVFAFARNEIHARDIADGIEPQVGSIIVTKPCNTGARVEGSRPA